MKQYTNINLTLQTIAYQQYRLHKCILNNVDCCVVPDIFRTPLEMQ